MRRHLALLVLVLMCGRARAQYATLVGTLAGASGISAANYTISLTPSQFFFVAGTSVVVNTPVQCATSVDGSVVGTGNPLQGPLVASAFSGTLPAGNYYVQVAWVDALTHTTLVSPETVQQLSSLGSLLISPSASGYPPTAVSMAVYVGASSGSETLQGTIAAGSSYLLNIPLAAGAAVPAANTTVCSVIANDAGWPTGTGYSVSLNDTSGNTLPGYPMMWQLLGPNTTINLSNGLPYYHGVVTYPVPILAQPLNHQVQSISGPLSLGAYSLLNVGRLGIGTALPGWPLDVNGLVNSSSGYLYQGGATLGWALIGDGVSFKPAPVTLSTPLYYQLINLNGVAQTARPAVNFSARFGASDSPSPAQTTIDLAASGVIPGNYANPQNISVDAYGRVLSVNNGTVTAASVIGSVSFTSCALIAYGGTDQNCVGTQSWPIGLTTGTYKVICTPIVPGFTTGQNNGGILSNTVGVISTTTTGFNYYVSNFHGSGGQTININCVAVL